MLSEYVSIEIYENILYCKRSFCNSFAIHEEIINIYKKVKHEWGGGIG